MELDVSKKAAEMQGSTTRADGVRYLILFLDTVNFSFVFLCLFFIC